MIFRALYICFIGVMLGIGLSFVGAALMMTGG